MAELNTTFEKQRNPGLLGSPHDELRLRIHGPKREGQLVVVQVQRCTIGSADSCSLPLHGPGIQPVQCIILRGQRGAVVRCLAPGTTLNGMQIQDAAIFAVDRLRIGPYELEVLLTVAKVNERKSTPNKETVPTSNAGIPTADAKYSVDGDPPSLGDLASLIEIRIKRIESQLAALQELEGGQATTWAPKSEEIRLAQQAIASLSQQLDCERERNGISFESLVAERDRLASELADATKTASDHCRELEQVRSEQVENDAAADLYSQRIDEVSDVHAQRIAEVSELSAQRIDEVAEVHAQRIDEVSELQEQRFAEISAEVDRLAEKITETDRHHQQACDRWQTSNDDLEQRLTNGVSQLTQLEEQLDLVRSNHEDTEAQRQLQGAQSEEIQESVRALKEQLSEQQSQQDELQAKWVTEHQELHDKFQHLEELHHQAITLRAAEPTRSSQPAPTAVVAPTVTPAYEPEPGTGTLSVDDLDDNARPEPEVSNGPLQWEDENPEEEQNQTPLSRLDQLRASRVVAEMQSQVDEVNASRPNDAFNDIEQQSRQQSQAGNEPESNPLDACLEMTSQDRNLDSQTDTDDQFNEGPTQPAVSDRDRMFDLLQAPNDGLPDETTVEAQPFDVDRTSPQMGSDLPAGEASPDNISALATGTSGPPNATGVPSLGLDEDATLPMTGAPVSAADILAKMGQPDIVEPDALIAHEPIDAAPDENLEECPKKDDAIGEDDDSIEAYMNQLLSRVRGDVDTDKTADVTKPEKESASKQDYEEFDDPVQQTDSSVLSELVARTEAPEQVEGLSAMRDLANDTTRSAIATYDMKSGGKSAFAKLVAAGLGVSAAVLSTLYLEDNPMVRLFGIGVGLSSAAVWTWQAVVLKQRSASVVQEPNSSSEDDSETTPSDEG